MAMDGVLSVALVTHPGPRGVITALPFRTNVGQIQVFVNVGLHNCITEEACLANKNSTSPY